MERRMNFGNNAYNSKGTTIKNILMPNIQYLYEDNSSRSCRRVKAQLHVSYSGVRVTTNVCASRCHTRACPP